MDLLIDSSDSYLSMGMALDGTLLAQYRSEPSGTQIGVILTAVLGLLRGVDADLSDVTTVAVVVGPGSMSGLRVGVSFAKTLAAFAGLSIVPLSSAEVMAEATFAGSEAQVAVLRRARKNEAYATWLEWDPEERYVAKARPLIVDPASVSDWFRRSEPTSKASVVITDRVAESFPIASLCGSERRIEWHEYSGGIVSAMARLAANRKSRAVEVRPQEVEISYVRGADVRISYQSRSQSGEVVWVKR